MSRLPTFSKPSRFLSKLTSPRSLGRALLNLLAYCMRVSVKENRVSDLLNNKKDGWNERRMMKIYGEHLGDQICKILILHNGLDDYRIWFHNTLGLYSTKSAYSCLTLKHVGFGPHQFLWRLTWKLQTLPKIKIFCWRLGHDILPKDKKISSIRREINSTCPRYGIEKETLLHMMKNYPKARAVLVYGGFNNNLIEGSYYRCVDWIEDVARTLDKKAFSDFITVEAKVTWERATTLSQDFRIFNLLEKP
ncbi:hypothetical protein Goshw_012189, partial [Gossypium schwendimanii]|nr:hypothetical protein [Gossypium schwendimanii]